MMCVHNIIGTMPSALDGVEADTFDGVFCDPPYELGFMSQSWDASGVSFQPETWAAVLRVCKPGAHLLAFGGSRTFHRLVCAVEDAGWEVRDVLMWMYGSGFPKSLNLKGAWDGYGTALKPAYEPVILARKPLDGTVAANVQKWGCGALWIDGGRIGHGDDKALGGNNGQPRGDGIHSKALKHSVPTDYAKGRWPANVLHDGSPDVVGLFPESRGQQGDVRGTEPSRTGGDGTTCYGEFGRVPAAKRGDTGSAARFFYCAKASTKERNAGCDGLPLVEGGIKNESGRGFSESDPYRNVMTRNAHPTVKPLDLCRYLAGLILPPAGRPHGARHLLVPFSGSGSEMIGSLLAGWEDVTGVEASDEYAAIARARVQHAMNENRERPVTLLEAM